MRIGTRASGLATAQARWVAQALCAAHPGLSVTLVPITTEGDRTQSSEAPGSGWGTGVFVRELESALLQGSIDLAVHSLKDLPPRLPVDLALHAIPPREDTADVLVTVDGCSLDELPTDARVGTSSARRAAFLRYARPDLSVLPIRGNVDTRIRKLLDGRFEAIVLARAGLVRLGLHVPHTTIDPAVLPPAPGQGALGLEGRAHDTTVRDLVAPLNDTATAAAVRAERQFMLDLEGTCRLPVAALATSLPGDQLELLGAVAALDGSCRLQTRGTGGAGAPEVLGRRIADELVAAGASRLLGCRVEREAVA